MKLYIDESGTLPDPNNKIIVLAAIVTNDSNKIIKIIKSIKARNKLRKNTGELKFYTASEKAKKDFFKQLLTTDAEIFILVVNKNKTKIEDSPDNFALLSWILFRDIFDYYSNLKNIIFDKHFSNKQDLDIFNQKLQSIYRFLPQIEHVDSSKNFAVNSADMIAGCVLANETGKNNELIKIINKKIISFRKIKWKELKRIYFQKKLA